MSDIDTVGFSNEIARCPRCGAEIILPHDRQAVCSECGGVESALSASNRALSAALSEFRAALSEDDYIDSDAGRAALTAPEPPAVAFECPNCDAVRVMEADGGGWRCPFCGWRSEAVPEPSLVCGKCGASIEIALHTDAGWFTVTHVCPQCGVVAQYSEKDQAEAAEERADNAERKLAAEREAHRALVEAAEELTRAALAVHDNSWQPRDSDWLRVDDDSVVDLGRAAEDCRDALAALEENNRE